MMHRKASRSVQTKGIKAVRDRERNKRNIKGIRLTEQFLLVKKTGFTHMNIIFIQNNICAENHARIPKLYLVLFF